MGKGRDNKYGGKGGNNNNNNEGKNGKSPYCHICKTNGHDTNKCNFNSKGGPNNNNNGNSRGGNHSRCNNCGTFGHQDTECRYCCGICNSALANHPNKSTTSCEQTYYRKVLENIARAVNVLDYCYYCGQRDHESSACGRAAIDAEQDRQINAEVQRRLNHGDANPQDLRPGEGVHFVRSYSGAPDYCLKCREFGHSIYERTKCPRFHQSGIGGGNGYGNSNGGFASSLSSVSNSSSGSGGSGGGGFTSSPFPQNVLKSHAAAAPHARAEQKIALACPCGRPPYELALSEVDRNLRAGNDLFACPSCGLKLPLPRIYSGSGGGPSSVVNGLGTSTAVNAFGNPIGPGYGHGGGFGSSGFAGPTWTQQGWSSNGGGGFGTNRNEGTGGRSFARRNGHGGDDADVEMEDAPLVLAQPYPTAHPGELPFYNGPGMPQFDYMYFNDGGNVQVWLPPLLDRVDPALGDEQGGWVQRGRLGLPTCPGCGVLGVVRDEHGDTVMAEADPACTNGLRGEVCLSEHARHDQACPGGYFMWTNIPQW
ncbi:hypothetical protein BDY21DRAFT_370833 [Lineolata rhizophorae]|uniref:CCHC-type domain-containing protein n=1 Tax=Lineolata rhizophorae TaxID=578093 RepID=A0A6A6P421_9PEZI|nr:hypothetical protein BDY21DRAFT_370833 [Lineolata rhizophorae]